MSVKPYTVWICDDCYALKGEMCHEPECIFCRRTMAEVGEVLDVLLIRPIVDGERLDLGSDVGRCVNHQGATHELVCAQCLTEEDDEQRAVLVEKIAGFVEEAAAAIRREFKALPMPTAPVET